jgi:IclR family acetate operon transcriptional repressor
LGARPFLPWAERVPHGERPGPTPSSLAWLTPRSISLIGSEIDAAEHFKRKQVRKTLLGTCSEIRLRAPRNTTSSAKTAPSTRVRRSAATATPERSDQVQSLVRALTLVNRLADADEGVSLTELAQQVGLSPSTAHRLLTTLEQERFVHYDAERRLWSVGVQAFMTGNAFLKTRHIVALARPHMRALMEDSEETVNLAVEDQFAAVYLAQVECRQMMRAFARPGGRVPLHCSSVGKALLSAMPDSLLSKVLHRQGLPRVTVKTINTTSALREDLARSRERGYAVDDEEHAVGLRCIAAVIFNENAEPIAAVSLSGPMVRIPDERIALLGEKVRLKADAITAQFGGRIPSGRTRG